MTKLTKDTASLALAAAEGIVAALAMNFALGGCVWMGIYGSVHQYLPIEGLLLFGVMLPLPLIQAALNRRRSLFVWAVANAATLVLVIIAVLGSAEFWAATLHLVPNCGMLYG